MRAKGYGSYRGRSPWKTFFKFLIAVLLILILLGGAAVLYLQQFLVVSSDGVRLNLPFFQSDEAEQPTDPTPDAADDLLEFVTPEPEPEPEPEPTSPVSLPREALADGSAAAQVAAAGGDCALFDMKEDSGALNYASSIALAQNVGAGSDSGGANDPIRALNETEGLYTVARVSCFKDHDITNYDRSLSIFTNSGYRWTDPQGIRWISPTNPDVREYLTAVCVELAQLGFAEILLDNAGYPDEGNLHYIKKGAAYDQTQFSTVIGGFYAQLADALSEYDVRLSVVTTAEAMSGQDTLTGQTPENLTLFFRLWSADETGALTPVSAGSDAP